MDPNPSEAQEDWVILNDILQFNIYFLEKESKLLLWSDSTFK